MKKDEKAREFARMVIKNRMPYGVTVQGNEFSETVPDHGSVQFAADGSAFVEVTLRIPAEALK